MNTTRKIRHGHDAAVSFAAAATMISVPFVEITSTVSILLMMAIGLVVRHFTR
ncbi:MAG: hypothetical protein PHG66_02490 [Candidatus Colwellbacteria bacterium]|nr:hypothetical protein [Candidatus Colwellbacteria bacterium]